MIFSLIFNSSIVYYYHLKTIYHKCLNDKLDFNTSWFTLFKAKPSCKPYSLLQVMFFSIHKLKLKKLFLQAFINTVRDLTCCFSKFAGLSVKDFFSSLFSNFNFSEKLLLFSISIKIILLKFRLFF
jgi:hypothetical protein